MPTTEAKCGSQSHVGTGSEMICLGCFWSGQQAIGPGGSCRAIRKFTPGVCEACPAMAPWVDSTTCLLPSHVRQATLWAAGSGRLGTLATTPTMWAGARPDSGSPKMQRSGLILVSAEAQRRPSSPASTSRWKGGIQILHLHQCRHQPPRQRRPPRQRQPLRQRHRQAEVAASSERAAVIVVTMAPAGATCLLATAQCAQAASTRVLRPHHAVAAGLLRRRRRRPRQPAAGSAATGEAARTAMGRATGALPLRATAREAAVGPIAAKGPVLLAKHR